MSANAVLHLQEAGFSPAQVKAIAEFQESGAATKKDLFELEQRVTTLIHNVELKISALETSTSNKFSEIRFSLVTWVVGVNLAQLAIIAGLIKFLH